MTALPIVSRELAAAAREPRVYHNRSIGALWGMAVLVVVLFFEGSASGPASQARMLFSMLAVGAFILCTTIGLAFADNLSLEKREGTLGLLFLTSLRGHDIVLGKIAARALGALYAILSLLPVLAIALLLGGIRLSDVFRMGLVWANALFLSLACAALASALSVDGRRATLSALGLVLLVLFGPLLAAFLLASPNNLFLGFWSSGIVDLSPIASLIIAIETAQGGMTIATFLEPRFLSNLAFGHATGWTLLWFASRVLPLAARGTPPSPRRMKWQQFADRWSYGEGNSRRQRRSTLLDQNPFLWLAGRHQRKTQYAWWFVLSMAAIWCPLLAAHTSLMMAWGFLYFLFWLLYGVLKIWWGTEACLRLGEDRRTGALELLLTTPVEVREFVHGHRLALQTIFLKPVLCLAAADILLTTTVVWRTVTNETERNVALGGLAARLVLVVVDAWAVRWVALWNALTRKTSQIAVNQTIVSVLVAPLVLTAVLSAAATSMAVLLSRTPPWFPYIPFLLLVISLPWSLGFGLSAKRKLLSQFRLIASEGFRKSALVRPDRKTTLAAFTFHFWRWPKLYSIPFGLAALSVAALLIHRAWWKHALGEPFARMRSLSMPRHFKDLAHTKLRVPAEANARPLLDQAATQLTPLRKWSTARYQNDEVPFRHKPFSSARLAQLGPEIDQNARCLELFRDAAALTGIEFPKSEYSLVDNPSVHFFKLQEPLLLAAAVRMDQGRLEEAVDLIAAQLRIGDMFANSPDWPGIYLHRGWQSQALNLMERLLSQHRLPAMTLQRLRAALPDYATPGFLGNLADSMGTYAILVRENGPGMLRRGVPVLPMTSNIDAFRWNVGNFTGLSDRDLSSCLHRVIRLKELSLLDWPAAREALVKLEPATGSHWLPGADYLGTISEGELILHGTLAGRLRCARVGLEIEEFRLKHGRLPTTLDALPPPSGPELRLDPFQKLPLIFEPLAQGSGFRVFLHQTSKNTSLSTNHAPTLGSRHNPIDFTVER